MGFRSDGPQMLDAGLYCCCQAMQLLRTRTHGRSGPSAVGPQACCFGLEKLARGIAECHGCNAIVSAADDGAR